MTEETASRQKMNWKMLEHVRLNTCATCEVRTMRWEAIRTDKKISFNDGRSSKLKICRSDKLSLLVMLSPSTKLPCTDFIMLFSKTNEEIMVYLCNQAHVNMAIQRLGLILVHDKGWCQLSTSVFFQVLYILWRCQKKERNTWETLQQHALRWDGVSGILNEQLLCL